MSPFASIGGFACGRENFGLTSIGSNRIDADRGACSIETTWSVERRRHETYRRGSRSSKMIAVPRAF